MKSFLLELGTEELPMKALPELAASLFDGVIAGLQGAGVSVDLTDAKPLYSPRRLTVLLPGVASSQADIDQEVLGPYVSIALDASGQPTKALEGFAAKNGVAWSSLDRTSDAKGERFVFRAQKKGSPTAELLPGIIERAVAGMPIPKPMRWGANTYGFARPMHWLIVMLGDEVIPMSLFGISSSSVSRGHRFMRDADVPVTPASYVAAMRNAFVLVDAQEREERVVSQAQAAASTVNGVARLNPSIVQEVVALVEWPVAVTCSFEEEFLKVPSEALIETMETNQKFFPVLNASGELTSTFIGTANIESKDVAQVRAGYERVIRPRFADAKFFFEEDLKQGLDGINEGLASVTYQAKLGSIRDKTERVRQLASVMSSFFGVSSVDAERAAVLSKADLQSRMVNEFPELQGIAGRYYALAQNESAAVAATLDEVYMPRNAGDDIAPSALGQLLSVADRLDTLAGGFAAGLRPTGNKDPFALRRHALGLARTLLGGKQDLLLHEWIDRAVTLQPVPLPDDLSSYDITQFVYDRLRNYFADRDVTASHFEAVNAVAHDSLADFELRLNAVSKFASLPSAEALAAANKRAVNILRKADAVIPTSVDASLLQEDAEKNLAAALVSVGAESDALIESHDYVGALTSLASLRPVVDAFFENVMVNAEDPGVRGNRLALVRDLSLRLGSIAAIEHLVA